MLYEAGIGVKRPYYLKKRGAYWYYRLNPESGLITGENLNYYTTGCRTREEAEAFTADMLREKHTPHSVAIRNRSSSGANRTAFHQRTYPPFVF